MLAFEGGGFETALQLGTAHALLVSRGTAPDLVVGVSAGAANATAVAEILQAGSEAADEEERLLRQTCRFRQVFARYQRAPGELFAALLPDSLQIETQRPLEALELPIHSQRERRWRAEALSSRSGLMNVVNQLLALRLPIGTVVGAVRSWLGWRAAGEMPRGIRGLLRWGETLRLLVLLAPQVVRLVPLAWMALTAVSRQDPPTGKSAGSLIFRSPSVRRAMMLPANALIAVLLIGAWAAASWLLLALLALPLLWAVLGTFRWWVRVRGVHPTAAGEERSLRASLGAAIWQALGPWSRLLPWAVAWTAAYAAIWLAPWWIGYALGRGPIGEPSTLIGWAVIAAVVALLLAVVAGWNSPWLLLSLLKRNRIAKGLIHRHPLRQLFVELFDREYFATVGGGNGFGEMDVVVSRALDPAELRPTASESESRDPKRIGDYAESSPQIHVGIVAADLADGESRLLPDDLPVIDALLAATAVSPLFPPKPLPVDGEERLLIDAANVANDPTRPALAHLRRLSAAGRLAEGVPEIHVYPVSSLPMSVAELPLAEGTEVATQLVSVLLRCLELQRFRDATLERRLTELYSRAIPFHEEHPSAVFEAGGKRYLRTWVYPIEPEDPVTSNQRLLRARDERERRTIMAETVADGCRAALEAMIQPSIAATAQGRSSIGCRLAVAHHVRGGTRRPTLPGSSPSGGPGVPEVCRHCALNREPGSERAQLNVRSSHPPRWPVGEEEVPLAGRMERPANPRKREAREALESFKTSPAFESEPWPRPRNGLPGDGRPTVSLLFGGGVFRGVFQVGVLNALAQVRLEPDVVAGASVGAITAAMAARVFSCQQEHERTEAVRRLAATYLAMDRLILTDRFADFIRTLTVRGAQTRFSLLEADRFFRRYDDGPAGRFDKQARKVLAGLERLFWISPFELLDLVRALRLQEVGRAEELLRSYGQEILDRTGVGGEILGTEPLQRLIREHVLRGLTGDSGIADGTFGDLRRSGIVLLATATNLSRGRLEILGEGLLGGETTSLLQGLLASSAFPVVFRPREKWEVDANSSTLELLADGGVMDNIPLDAVAQFLLLAAKTKLVARRPPSRVPHLLFSASLQPIVDPPDPAERMKLDESWIRVYKRSRKLSYNQKLEIYRRAQTAVRTIYEDSAAARRDLEPLDLEVVTVRPRWLCGTYAFHPMLGFGRREQARSIAHGCRATLFRLAAVGNEHRKGWGLEGDDLLPDTERPEARRKKEIGKGMCWYRRKQPCPFAKIQLAKDSGLPEITRDALSSIHRECGKAQTHNRQS